MNKTISSRGRLLLLFLMSILTVGAWDFCAPNEDGVMFYYDRIADDEEACEIVLCRGAIYVCDTLKIPETAICPGNQERGDPDTLLQVIGIAKQAFRYIDDGNADVRYNGKCQFSRVRISHNLCYIGDRAFCGVPVEEIIWPENIEWLRSLGKDVFKDTALRKLIIPRTVSDIPEEAFSMNRIDTVEFEEGNKYLESIPVGCFRSAFVREVRLCSSVETIEEEAFTRSSLTKIVLSSNLKTIGERAFSRCYFLEAPELPYGLEFIKEEAFYNHKKWKSFEIPATIRDIGDYALCAWVSPEPEDRRELEIDMLYVNKMTPPYCTSTKVLGDNTYDKVTKTYNSTIYGTKLIIPSGTTMIYHTTWPWSRFAETNIYTRDISGIERPELAGLEVESIFLPDGRQTNVWQKGLNIIRYKGGMTKKILKR